ncbi:MAG: SPOR domain-containing protein [Treponema sp.]|nr:SPOR domain-containing protein [Treponema sp.]
MKKVLAVACAFLFSALAFADGWYVCMGSFKNLDKANERARILNNSGFSVFVSEVEKANSEKLYRVLFTQSFPTKKEASSKRNELLGKQKIKSMGLNDLWCCESSGRRAGENPVSLNQRVVVTNQQQNEEATPVKPAPVSQTIVVSVNGEEQQRFEINSDDRLIKINVKVDESEPPSIDEARLSKSLENADELTEPTELDEVPLEKSLDKNAGNNEAGVETVQTDSADAADDAAKADAAENTESSASEKSDAAEENAENAVAETAEEIDEKTVADAKKNDAENAAVAEENTGNSSEPASDEVIEPAVEDESAYPSVEDAK